jgi:tetratricopeptide (TPR) repeat protein
VLAALAAAGGAEPGRVQYELAWACRRDGDEPAALAAFAQCLAATTDAELAGEARLHLGEAALAGTGLAAARPLFEAVTGSHRGRALYRLGFAELEAAGQDAAQLAQARGRFDAIAAIEGEQLVPEALFLGAECSHRLGDPRGVVARAERLLAGAAEHARADLARLLLGGAAVELGDAERAVPALERFLRGAAAAGTDQLRGLLALGRARLLRGEHARAEENLRKVTAASDGPLAAEAQFRIGECRRAAGDLPGAAEAFLELPILYGHQEWVRQGLLQAGLVYEQLQQPEKAARVFRELVERHADSPEAATAAEHLGGR